MRELSLFTGAGGGLLGSKLLGWRTVGAVEIDKFCCERVGQRRDEGHLGEWFPIWNMDIRDFNQRIAPSYTGLVDVVSGGFPCQPFSVAGKRLGEDDPRNMWPATIECVRVVRPRYCFFENVPGLLAGHGYFGTILGDLAESGYDARWRVLSAAELGAPHKRDRLWIVADANVLRRGRRPTEAGREAGVFAAGSGGWDSVADSTELQLRRESHAGVDGAGHPCAGAVPGQEAVLADAKSTIRERDGSESSGKSRRPTDCGWWEIEPRVGRVVDELASRLDRLKAIGNGQVPIVAATAWRLLTDNTGE